MNKQSEENAFASKIINLIYLSKFMFDFYSLFDISMFLIEKDYFGVNHILFVEINFE